MIIEEYIVFDEYRDEHFHCQCLDEAQQCTKESIKRMIEDGGADSECSCYIFKRIGYITGTIEVNVKEHWDEDQLTINEDGDHVHPSEYDAEDHASQVL